MWLLTIRAVPKPESELAHESGVAYVSCWVNFQLQDGAEILAKHYIDQAGWLPEEVEDVAWVEADGYADDPKHAIYHSEAETEGVILVFHKWSTPGEGKKKPASGAA